LLVTSPRNGVVSAVSCWKVEICRLQATGLFYWVYSKTFIVYTIKTTLASLFKKTTASKQQTSRLIRKSMQRS